MPLRFKRLQPQEPQLITGAPNMNIEKPQINPYPLEVRFRSEPDVTSRAYRYKPYRTKLASTIMGKTLKRDWRDVLKNANIQIQNTRNINKSREMNQYYKDKGIYLHIKDVDPDFQNEKNKRSWKQ